MFTLSTILIFDIGTVPTAWYCFSFYVSTFIGTVPTAWYCFSFYVSTFIGTVPTAWYCFSFYVSTFIGIVPTALYCFSFYLSTFIVTGRICNIPQISQYLVLLDKDIILIKKTN
jgi:hypothetical protein